ncbi:Zn-dependent oligopeptidase, partial [bacterium]|nr:Zn-dependent oligopeptidase [bacterium]
DLLDRNSNLNPFGYACAVLKEVSPDLQVRRAAHDALKVVSEFEIDFVSGNIELYKAFKAYVDGNGKKEKLRDDQIYFIEETLKGFKRLGFDLPEGQRKKTQELRKKLVDASLVFGRNVSDDASEITATGEELAGVEQDFINALEKTDKGLYRLKTDYPTYFNIIDNCTVEETRKRLYRSFNNKAYPKNVEVLKDVIAKRDELAKLLGYKSYAHLNLENQMIKTPERADAFLNDLLKKLNKKEQQEFELLKKELPESVVLTKEGIFKPWDIRFILNAYKKKLAVDENKIAQYFQLENTLDAMFSLYEDFFGVRFELVQTDQFWHPDVKLAKLFDADSKKLLSYMLFDLHPRPNKFGHAAHFGILPGFTEEKNEWPAVGFIVANFPPSTKNRPSLIKLDQVNTLFHEFGHAMHHVLGRTRLISQAGTSTTTDFVEVPSQMLEDWLLDAQVLKKISKHYQTGKPISDQQLEKILALKQFDRGWFWQRQAFFALLSLEYFKSGAQKDLDKVYWDVQKKVVPHIALDKTVHQHASFGHLMSYGARYYGYIWSKILSTDVFEHIKQQGLLKPDAGHRYVELIVSKGGSKDPNKLIQDFLGREPNDAAFCKHMGLN